MNEQIEDVVTQIVAAGWKVSEIVDDGVTGFIIGTPRVNGVRTNTSVWVDDEDPAHKLLATMLVSLRRGVKIGVDKEATTP